jgi:oligogalacturonide lyase
MTDASPLAGRGRRFPPESRTYVDLKTGQPITALSTSTANDSKIYQDHPQWTACGRWIVFRSDRGCPAGVHQAFALHEVSGEIVQLTEGAGLFAGTLNVARLSDKLYYLRAQADGRVALVELTMGPLLKTSGDLADAAAAAPQASGTPPEAALNAENAQAAAAPSAAGPGAAAAAEPAAAERVIAYVPDGFREAGGFALDADEKTAYLGARELTAAERRGEPLPKYVPGTPIPPVPSRLFAIDLASGRTETIAETPFLMGHVQTNPWVGGEIVFCNETGGDAPQRMYTMRLGQAYRPLYVETPDEWITHEAVVTKDEVIFAIMGHLPRLRKKPTGLAVINLRTDEMKILGQCDVGNGFWHVNGSPDGRWAVGDDFDGNIHLIDRRTGRMTTLTTGHVMKPDHAHPTFSPDSKRILFQSGYLSGGRNLNLMTVAVGPAE